MSAWFFSFSMATPSFFVRSAAYVLLSVAGLQGLRAQIGAAAPRESNLGLQKWSGDFNVPDPVAVTVDPQGRVYVTSTTRRKAADLDIREHRMWIPQDVALTSVEEKRALLKRELAPGQLRLPRGMLADHNGDGSIDWHDLTVPKESIYQLRDTDGDGTADRMTVFAEGFNDMVNGIAAGVLYHDGWVYVTVAPELWRLKDTDDDGVADIRERLVDGIGLHFGYAGHDMHGLMVGPDGRIYWSIGDKGLNVTSKEGRHFFYPNEGGVFRIEPDGSGFEVYAHGLRNVQEPAFDDFGDLFGVDNDADMIGERERFVFILEGSDSGWRCNYQYMGEASPWMTEGLWKPAFPGQSAHHLPPISNYSDGPAGFRHEPGTALSDAQRGMFLLNEFPSGKMRAFRVEQEGASYRMVDARILHEGVMGIGMTWHPDGSLLMADWIGGYPLDGLGALWKVDAKSGMENTARRETHALLSAGFARRAAAELRSLTGHRDQRVRQGAQFELAARNESVALLGLASDPEGSLLSRVHGIWGYGQLLRRGAAGVEGVIPLLADAHPEVRRQVVRVLGDVPRGQAPAAPIIALLADASPRVRVQAAVALGKLRVPEALEPLWRWVETEGADPLVRHAAVFALAGCARPEELAGKKGAGSTSQRLAAVLALRKLGSPLVAPFLADADAQVVAEAVRAIHDNQGIPDALPSLAALLDTAPADDSVMRRAINANLRVGTEVEAVRLATFALNEAASPEYRAAALEALRVWPAPPSLDLVDGCARTFPGRPIAAELTPYLADLLALTDPALKSLAIRVMIAHSLQASPDQIAAIVIDSKAEGDLRATALKLLGPHLDDPAYGDRVLNVALEAGAPPTLRMAAMESLLAGRKDRLVTEARTVLGRRPVAEQQHAIALLARAQDPKADDLLLDLGRGLAAERCDPALKLDVIDALTARAETVGEFGRLLEAYARSESGKSHGELISGGDRTIGEAIVKTHLNANCLACHSLTNTGGSEVGPNLRNIGSQRTPELLLESLLNPSATIATGFGLVTVVLRDGSTISGTLAKEEEKTVTVRQFDGQFQHIPRANIKELSAPVSIMPPMLGILQPREIRDVVTFLAAQKPQPRPPRPVRGASGD